MTTSEKIKATAEKVFEARSRFHFLTDEKKTITVTAYEHVKRSSIHFRDGHKASAVFSIRSYVSHPLTVSIAVSKLGYSQLILVKSDNKL